MTALAERFSGPGRPGRDDAAFDRRLIPPLIIGSVLNPVNTSMIAVALIPIGLAFGAPPAQTAWLVTSLYLTTAVGQPVVGRLVDMFGPRRLYLAGTGLVGVAGLIGAFAPNLLVLVLARVLLGLGTCAAYPAAMYLIRTEADRTGKESPAGVLAALSIANQTIAFIGPTLGGLLIAVGGWRAIFTVNVPLALLCLVLGYRRLPRTVVENRGPRAWSRVDPSGVLLFVATLVALMLAIMEEAWWLLPVAVVAGAAFAHRELHATDPFVDLRLLGGNPPLLVTYLRMFLSGITGYAFLYGYVQWLEEGRGMSATEAGLLLLPMSGTSILVSAVTGRREAVRVKLVVGALSQVLVLIGGLMGIPQGLLSLANQNALYRQADRARMGSAAGLLRTFMYLGAIAAAAAVAAAFPAGADTPGLHHLGEFVLGCSGLLLVVVLVDRSLTAARKVPA